MGAMSEFDLMLREVSEAMGEPVSEKELAESLVAQKVNSIINSLDDLVIMVRKGEHIELIENEKPSLGLIKTRIDLLLSFLLAQKPTGLKVVR